MKRGINRNNKDSLFRLLFSEKEELLSLYNAIRGSSYTNADDLEVNTLENAIYMGVKNDISFVIGGELLLYEHQSTRNGNIALRNLIYVTNLYSGMVEGKNLYGGEILPLPRPEFVVFYNGIAPAPDRSVQRLSDVYISIDGAVNLDLKVVVLNINKGHNLELMDKCRTLREYAYYVDAVRNYSKCMPIDEAVDKAILTCIENDVLADYLRSHRAEVKNVSIFEYDAEKHIAMEKEESRSEGHAEGRAEERAELHVDLIKRSLGSELSVRQIAHFVGVEVEYVEKIGELLQQYPEESETVIARKLLAKKL